MIKAEIIADSLNGATGARLTTFVLEFPRIVLAEFNTHRVLSRNSASSRAIPFNKMLERVSSDPFIPIKFMKEHTGMQGNEFFESQNAIAILKGNWLKARDSAIEQAKNLSEFGLTKQIVNRLLEPFMWHRVIATATDWQNYFALRAHEAAEIHIADLAEKMLGAYNTSSPKELDVGEWHIPFGDRFDEARVRELLFDLGPAPSEDDKIDIESLKVKIATARCARISYFNFEGQDDYSADVKLHDRLKKLGHWSPFEHCAVAGNVGRNSSTGNFNGFIQYRKQFQGENKTDSRVK